MRKLLLFVFLITTVSSFANVTLPKIFSHHMVLQRNKPIHVWGWAAAGENIQVSLGSTTQKTKANKQGKWELSLPSMPAGGPHTLIVKGKNTIQLDDVMIGEVWLCSGQSNMEWPLNRAANAQQEIAQANYPLIRHIKVPRTTAVQPQDNITGGQWEVCSSSTAAEFTAVGYFFARELYKELNVPIGLINSSWGGTIVETWISNESFFSDPEFAALKSRMPTNIDSMIQTRKLALDNMVKTVQNGLPSTAEERSFASAEYNDAEWKTMKLPTYWETAGLANLDGTVWFRKEIIIPDGSNAAKAVLSLGPIDDIDSTFINGKFVGHTNAYNVPRNYNIPDGILKSGKNIIAVKVIDNAGNGGLYATSDQMKLQLGESAIPLTGDWKFRIMRYVAVTSISPNQYPTLLYNGMIHPLIGYAIAGAIWYQGESNAGRSYQYKTSFPLMIKDWRKQWKEAFPFYFVQLANFNAANGSNRTGGSGWAELREAQTETLQLPNTGMAVIIDIGESSDIHPRNKQDVGKRLAANALSKTYGKNVAFSGPVFQSMQVQGNKAMLSFQHAENGFEIKNKYGYIHGFEIAGVDQQFHYAKAFVEGDKIVVFSEAVSQPVSVRYAWADDPNDVNLYNKAGFPAHPFRIDKWKGKTEGVKFEFR